jgi:hemerythrin-like domain-containing protein
MTQAIRVIHDEHRALGAVLHGLLYVVREIRDRGAAPDFALLEAMVRYIDAFPERYHHPKEDAHLFRLLRLRRPDAAPLLDRLQEDHRIGATRIRELESALARYRDEGGAAFAPFAAAAESYTAFHSEHMHAEDTEVIPLAEEALTAADWEAIDAAFAGHTDPLLAPETGTELEQLFHRIVNLAPAPIGLGPAR